ncbi:VanW family protein [Pseudaestuariivita rosea]|uniref:VanW family protein n=1 Tax=Pseudaestuariivita rosea TaxID=2763263 RepID=UPI001ABAAFF8|nr:VanW family protein [Pseudaestuariivita rosea]
MKSPRKPLTSYHPALHQARVWQRQAVRWARWYWGREDFATDRQSDLLPNKIYRHQSKLRRSLADDPRENLWQDNKIHNHSLAIPHLNGVLIHPGQTFSIWRLVGRPTVRRRFKEGMELHLGRARGGIGGGLCQIANLIHWLALHSPLQVTQRASHSFDPFPDQGRVIPYGTGAALFYNYIDLWLFNPTQTTVQLHLWMTDTLLNGEFRCDGAHPHRYHVYEKNAGFTKSGDTWFRYNEIWRDTSTKGEAPEVLKSEKLYANHVRVLYEPEL